jgi:hypothetical protein
MGLPEGRNQEDIRLFLDFLMLFMIYFLGYPGPKLAEEVFTIHSDALDSHEVDE